MTLKDFGSSLIEALLVNQIARPEKIRCVAIVAINDGIFRTVTEKPLMHPIITPMESIAIIASTTKRPEFPSLEIYAPIMLLKPIIPIIEKSMPPFINTNVSPAESMHRKDACVKTESRFAAFEKPGINRMEIRRYKIKKGMIVFFNKNLPIIFTGLFTKSSTPIFIFCWLMRFFYLPHQPAYYFVEFETISITDHLKSLIITYLFAPSQP